MTKLLTPRQVAESLGVSESSLKRWCDQGVLEAVRTPGGHRKIALEEVVRFLRDSERPLVRPEVIGLPNVGRRLSLKNGRRELEPLLIQGEMDRCRQLSMGLYLSGFSIVDICDQVFAPLMHHIGEQWECGKVEVYEEHRAVEVLVNALHELRNVLKAPKADAFHAIGGSIEGDCYDLPTRMIELCLREQGWRATSLGPSLPVSTILAAVKASRPALVWLSVATVPQGCQIEEQVNHLFQELPHSTSLAVGGRAIDAGMRQKLRATLFCDNLRQLCDFVDTTYGSFSKKHSHANAAAN